MRGIAAHGFYVAWKKLFHGVEKSIKVFTFYVKLAESFYVPWKKGVKSGRGHGIVPVQIGRWIDMSKAMMLGLALLAAFVIVLIMTSGRVSVNLFSMTVTLKTSYALLAAAGVGVVAGALLRK